ncbi:5-oxoprolinase subunit PxpB [Ottowia thiooxydans]|uniref:Inhibitor of KinA n=1 Tax=Ottowia thiooxydans TaxID=219182 RepID=A0ABV2QEW7_9BURK
MQKISPEPLVIEPVGDRCVLIRLGQGIDLATSQKAHAVTEFLKTQRIPGLNEVVPAFNSVAVHFNPMAYAMDDGLPTAQVAQQLKQLLATDLPARVGTGRLVEIPACYGGEFGPDLEEVAERSGLTVEQTIALHSERAMALYTYFFAPGNPFFGPLHPDLRVGRRASPRTRLEAGSVGIANGLSTVYASASPGGWNIIARTPWTFFDVHQDPPVRLQLGDEVRFKPITPSEFEQMREERA